MRKMKAICPIFYADNQEFDKEYEELQSSSTDLIEVRMDRFFGLGLERSVDYKKLQESKKPLILTLRTSKEGGECSLETWDYEDKIHEFCLNMPQALVDVELSRIKDFKNKPDMSRIVLSFHDFKKTPENLDQVWQEMEMYHPKIEKIAVMPEHAQDVTRLLYSCLHHESQSEKIAISMSELGSYSRLMGYQFESGYTFCSLHTSSAPGQLSLDKLDELSEKI